MVVHIQVVAIFTGCTGRIIKAGSTRWPAVKTLSGERIVVLRAFAERLIASKCEGYVIEGDNDDAVVDAHILELEVAFLTLKAVVTCGTHAAASFAGLASLVP